jgi:uncharacterized protein (DUF1684 family)
MILYDYDCNAILTTPLKDRKGPTTKQAYEQLHGLLIQKGYQPKSIALKEFMSDEGIKFQLTPPGMHCRNAAEQAICTFKNHFITGLAMTGKKFPMKLWVHLLEQAQITLNLL